MNLNNSSMGLGRSDCGIQIRKRNEKDIVVALAGNPNVGKSTVFNVMTGLKQHTGNWAGKTVMSAQGYASHEGQGYAVVDIPGCYSLCANSPEEEIARDFICSGTADVVVAVCDAVCLERSMGLVLQIMQQTGQVVVCVNLMDEAAKKGIEIDLELLEARLGVPVVGTAARSGQGISQLHRAIDKVYQHSHEGIQHDMGKRGLDTVSEEICRGIVEYRDSRYLERELRRDRFFVGKRTAFPIMLLFLSGAFWLTIEGANYPSQWLYMFFSCLEEKLMEGCVRLAVPESIREMLIFGVYRVVSWIVSVMLPPMAIFFPLFTILEDSGYLPRAAFNMDKCFRKCHACGKQCLTMCMGLGCNAAGVTGCRIIDSPRERLIAIITNSFVPCNGRFPVLIALITMFFVQGKRGIGKSVAAALVLAGFILLGIGVTFLISRLLSATILKGMPSAFVLELPPYRRPQIGRVIIHSIFDRVIFVLGRAVAAAAPAGLFIWLLANVQTGGITLLTRMSEALQPFAGLLGLDGAILLAFVLGLPANEIVLPLILMIYLTQGSLTEIKDTEVIREILVRNGWTWKTAVCTMLFAVFHSPCITTCLTIRRETGSIKWTLVSMILPLVIGCTICMLFTFLTGYIK